MAALVFDVTKKDSLAISGSSASPGTGLTPTSTPILVAFTTSAVGFNNNNISGGGNQQQQQQQPTSTIIAPAKLPVLLSVMHPASKTSVSSSSTTFSPPSSASSTSTSSPPLTFDQQQIIRLVKNEDTSQQQEYVHNKEALNNAKTMVESCSNNNNSSSSSSSKIASTAPTTTSGTSGETVGLSGVEQLISPTSRQKIDEILTLVNELKDIEKLYLYLHLPDGPAANANVVDKKKASIYNPFGKKTDVEIVQTYAWIESHLEMDSSVSIPKQEVYEDYSAYCAANRLERLCVADFGKAMKHVFPQVKARRLGQRGSSKYCYSGLRKRALVEPPALPLLDTSEYSRPGSPEEPPDKVTHRSVDTLAWNVIQDWAEKTFNRKFKNSLDLARFIKDNPNLCMDFGRTNKAEVSTQANPKLAQLLTAPPSKEQQQQQQQPFLQPQAATTTLDLTKVSNPMEQIQIVYSNGVTAPRYKPIQPRLEPTVANANNNKDNDKRRHSVATPFETNGSGSLVYLVRNDAYGEDKNYKRQFEEKEVPAAQQSKKRHVEVAGEVPLAAQQHGQLSFTSDLKINELENEALRDYLSNQAGGGHTTTGQQQYDNAERQQTIIKLRHHSNDSALVSHTTPQQQQQQQQVINPCAGVIRMSNDFTPTTSRLVTCNFQPISARNTPTIPEHSPLNNVYCNNNNSNNNNNNSLRYQAQPNGFVNQQQAPMVGMPASACSSATTSPFVSPRHTPVPMCSRSRNSSGQSNNNFNITTNNNNNNNSNLFRQTPLLDSGISSSGSSVVSFLSPQSTPTIRNLLLENNSIRTINNNNNNNATRARHSSGPGGPVCNRMIVGDNMTPSLMVYNRSNSLSPMIVTGNSQHAVVAEATERDQLDETPVNLQLQDQKIFNHDLMTKLCDFSNTTPVQQPKSAAMLSTSFSFDFVDTNGSGGDGSNNNNKQRQRHQSAFCGVTAPMVSKEVAPPDMFRLAMNRSHSVPMFEHNNSFDELGNVIDYQQLPMAEQDVVVSSVQLLTSDDNSEQQQQVSNIATSSSSEKNNEDVFTDLLNDNFAGMPDFRDCDNCDDFGLDIGNQTNTFEDDVHSGFI